MFVKQQYKSILTIIIFITQVVFILSCQKDIPRVEKNIITEVKKNDLCFDLSGVIVDLGENNQFVQYGYTLSSSNDTIIYLDKTDKAKEISINLKNLQPNQDYNIKLFTKIGDKFIYSNVINFNTSQVSLIDSCVIIKNSSSSITAKIYIKNNSCSFNNFNSIGLVTWNDGFRLTSDEIKITSNQNVFEFNVDNLKNNTQYYLSPYINFSSIGDTSNRFYGTGNSVVLSSLKITTNNIGVLQNNKLPIYFSIDEIGDDKINEIGIVYSTNTSTPNYNNSKILINPPSSNGMYNIDIINPSLNTTYYYRAFANINNNKIIYGTIKSFKL